MAVVEELERAVREMAERQVAPGLGRRSRRWWRWGGSRRLGLLVAAGVLIMATAALAASGVIQIGSPLHDPAAGHRRSDVGLGTVVPGTVKVLELRTADPDGGPPWGLRIVSTTRGLGCLQFGRVVDGRLGVLGRDGVFGNDGRFHELPAGDVGPAGCAQLDAHQRLFTNAVAGAVPAAGTTDGACMPPHNTSGVPASQLCEERDERMLYFGTLGPQFAGLTYRDQAGGQRTVKGAGPYGAYLIVTRRDGDYRNAGFSSGSLGPFDTPITEFRFTTGLTCAVTEHGFAAGAGSCPLPGYAAAPKPTVTAAEVKAPVRARVVRAGHHYNLVVTFRAPIAITDARTTYEITQRKQGARNWGSSTTQRNLRAGELVHQTFIAMRAGIHRVSVTYQPHANGTSVGNPRGALLVGHWTVRVP